MTRDLFGPTLIVDGPRTYACSCCNDNPQRHEENRWRMWPSVFAALDSLDAWVGGSTHD